MGSDFPELQAFQKGVNQPMHVLIIGAGIVGLTIAQGCRENGIPYSLFERDKEGNRSQGWGLTLHWALDALERTIGPERAAKMPSAVVDRTLNVDAGNFLFLNYETGEIRHKIAPSNRRFRFHRQKMRQVLTDGLSIQEEKKFVEFEELEDGVRARFEDGTHADGTILIGADGNNSSVRKCLLPDDYALNPLPVHMLGVVRHFSADQGEAIRKIDPILFQGLHPKTGTYMWYSIQEVNEEPDGRVSFDALVIISWIIKDPIKDAIPSTHPERIALMKSRGKDFAEPFRSIVMDIPNDLDLVTPLRLGDFPCREWVNRGGRVTLAGDSAHGMSMYRGEAANHGIVDAALIVDQLKKIRRVEIAQKVAVDQYEAEMRPRTQAAVLKSRAAALVAHEWENVTEDSPVIGARIAPPTAFKSPFV